MRYWAFCLFVCAGCDGIPFISLPGEDENEDGEQASQAETELSRAQCAEMVRRIQRLESDEGTALAAKAGFGGSMEGCLRRGTEDAYRCIMQAHDKNDLEPCERLYR